MALLCYCEYRNFKHGCIGNTGNPFIYFLFNGDGTYLTLGTRHYISGGGGVFIACKLFSSERKQSFFLAINV